MAPTGTQQRPAVTAAAPVSPGLRPPGLRRPGWWSALVEAWAEIPVRRGLLAAALICLGGLTPSYLPEASPLRGFALVGWFDTLAGRTLGTIALMLGVALLLDAWLRLRPRFGLEAVNYRAVLVIWAVPFLLAPPIFSADAYAYAAEGWLIHHGLNPYEIGVGALPGPLADQTALVWRWTPAPYGPLDLQLNHLVVDLTGGHPYLSVIAMRVPVLLGLAAVAYVLPRIARRLGVDPGLAMWLGLVNPLTVVHFVGGVHNDAIMVGLIFLGLWAAMNGRLVLACLLVAAATAVKVPAVVAVLAVAVLSDPALTGLHSLSLPERVRASLNERARQWRMIRRAAVAGVLTVVGFLAINLATGLGFGWIAGMNVPGMVKTMSPSTMIGDSIGLFFAELGQYDLAFGSLRVVRTLFMLSCVAVILWLSFRVAHRRPLAALAWSLLAVAVAGPVLHGWYVFWGASLLGLTRPSLRVQRIVVWASTFLLGYIAMNAAWKNGVTLLGATALGLIAWRVWLYDREQSADAVDFQPALGMVRATR